MVHWVMLHTTYLDPVVSDRQEGFLYVFIMLVNVNSDTQDKTLGLLFSDKNIFLMFSIYNKTYQWGKNLANYK